MVPGQQIAPTLTLVRPLAKGSMGSVWVADHLALGTQVAVKFMSPSLAGDPELVARFQQEAMAAARIKSPHVAQVFDHGIAEDGAPYIVMELLEGDSLGRHLAQRGPLPPGEVARIVTQAARALAKAHRLGIVHRDIKPDNLFLLDVEGELFVKVLDFGVAKQSADGWALGGVTSTGILVGTPLYMSPEQTRSARRVDHRADLWSLAAVAYHALTGEPPFKGPSMAALLVAVNEGVFAPPSRLRPELPPEVDAWAARALEREPEARFGSALEMAEALEAALRGAGAPQAAIGPAGGMQQEPAAVAEVTATTPSGLPGLRGPLLIAGMAVGAAIVVAVAAWVAGGDDAAGTSENTAKNEQAIGAAHLDPVGQAVLPATAGPAAPPDAGAPDGEASPPAPPSSAPAQAGGPEAAEPRPIRPTRPSSRKKAKEDDIGF